jgi:succinyl-CoA synthetase beta subunit
MLVDRHSSRSAIICLDRGRHEHRGGRRRRRPEKIHTFPVDPATGVSSRSTAARSPSRSGCTASRSSNASKLIDSLYKMFLETDCALLEINPLILDGDGDLRLPRLPS